MLNDSKTCPIPPKPEEDCYVSSPPDKKTVYQALANYMNQVADQKTDALLQTLVEEHDIKLPKRRKIFGEKDGHWVFTQGLKMVVECLLSTEGFNPEKGKILQLPGDLGSLELGVSQETKKVSPQKQLVTIPMQWRVKYRPGKFVKTALKEKEPPKPKI